MDDVAIIARSLSWKDRFCGVAESARYLAAQLGCAAVSGIDELPPTAKIVFIEVEHGVCDFSVGSVISEIMLLKHQGRIPVVNYHSTPTFAKTWVPILKKYCLVGGRVFPPDPETLYLPLIGPEAEPDDVGPPAELMLGTFGFCGPHKRQDLIIQLALRLELPLVVMAANNGPHADVQENLVRIANNNPLIELDFNFLPINEVIRRLRGCSHLISAVQDYPNTVDGPGSGASASLRTMAAARRPLIGVKHYRVADVGGIEVDSLDDITIEWLEKQTALPKPANDLTPYLKLIEELRDLLTRPEDMKRWYGYA